MPATLWAANRDEIDDLIIWLDDHPDDADLLARDAVAHWLVNLWQNTNEFPSSTVVPRWAAGLLGALIEDWAEVLTAHNEEFFTNLRGVSN